MVRGGEDRCAVDQAVRWRARRTLRPSARSLRSGRRPDRSACVPVAAASGAILERSTPPWVTLRIGLPTAPIPQSDFADMTTTMDIEIVRHQDRTRTRDSTPGPARLPLRRVNRWVHGPDRVRADDAGGRGPGRIAADHRRSDAAERPGAWSAKAARWVAKHGPACISELRQGSRSRGVWVLVAARPGSRSASTATSGSTSPPSRSPPAARRARISAAASRSRPFANCSPPSRARPARAVGLGARPGAVQGSLRGLGGGPARGRARHRGHRRQDLAAQPRPRQGRPLHLVSAWASRQRLVLGQQAVRPSPTRSPPFRCCWSGWR